MSREIHARLEFDPAEVDIDKLREAERLLSEAGFYCDKGQGIYRNWQLDWSLEGANLVLTNPRPDDTPDWPHPGVADDSSE